MGYTTDFMGEVAINPPLNEHEISFLKDFNRTRRMNRTTGPLHMPDTTNYGQNRTPDIIDFNQPHPDQPGLWCQWEPSDDGTELSWDGGEKFYNATEWMEYIVNSLLSEEANAYVQQHVNEDPRLAHFTCDHMVNGVIYAEGEDSDDRWKLVVEDNVVKAYDAEVIYADEREPEPTPPTEAELKEALRSLGAPTTTVTIWTALVTLYGNPSVTVHASEGEAWESLRANYADELGQDVDRAKLEEVLDDQGIGYAVNSHEVEVTL